MLSIHHVIHLHCNWFTVSLIHHHGPWYPLIMPSIHIVIHFINSPCHPYTMSSFRHVIHSTYHPFTMMFHAIRLPYYPFTMSSSHLGIHSLCHPITMTSIYVIQSSVHHAIQSPYHPAINSHLKCRPFTMSSNQDHGPCHPFTMSSIHGLGQSPCHSGPISSYHPQVRRPGEFIYKEFPKALAAKTYLYCRPLNYSNLGSNHGRHYSSLCSCCVWFYSTIASSHANNYFYFRVE